MILTQKHLARRTILRGVGATLALPLLDAMVPAHAAMRTTAANPVRRLGAVYVPMGVNMAQWTPKRTGALELTPTLQTLAPFKQNLLVVTGLDMDTAVPGAEDGGGQHSRVQSSWLTGVHAKKTDGPGFEAGTTMDQFVARAMESETQFASLEMGLESVDLVGACEIGYTCAYTGTLSWRTPKTPLPMETNPRVMFERLFGDSGTTDTRTRLARDQKNKSLLDSVQQSITRLQKGIGPSDNAKLTDYLESVRDIERRIQRAEEQAERDLPVVEQPAGIPTSYEEHSRLMFDLWALAWQTDMTRVSTFMMARELSVRTYPDIGVNEPHHPLSHHQDNPEKLAKQAKLNVYHLKLFSYFLEKLAAMPDGDGSVLDHSMILYGSGMSNSNLHLPKNLPLVVIGNGAGQIRSGRHIRAAAGTPVTNLQLTLIEKMGVRLDRFGDSTGTLNLLSDV
ncbi:MAG: DUF1552 domain-containing protein [Vicinamibacterales bacterium]